MPSKNTLLLNHRRKSPGRKIALRLLLLLLVITPSGCVTRRLTIQSNPPGALVYIDNQEVGVTPVSTPFTYYGTRDIRLVRDGYETLSVAKTFHPPWYEYPGIDFVSENLWPQEIHDDRIVNFDLLPKQIIATDDLVRRAEILRSASATGLIAPLPDALPGAIGPPPIERLQNPAGPNPVLPDAGTFQPPTENNSIMVPQEPSALERPIRPPSESAWEGY